MEKLQLLTPLYFDVYQKQQPLTILKHFNKMCRDLSASELAIECAVVHSSMIEGNRMDFRQYMKSLYFIIESNAFTENEDLKEAYFFAKENTITFENVLKAHEIMSKNIIKVNRFRGTIRDTGVGIISNGEIIYRAASPEIVADELGKLLSDVGILIEQDLTIDEMFYYASYIHMVFAKIHPFVDGNGRMARLLEKWFLAQKLGDNAWNIQSEMWYQQRLWQYYTSINIGETYSTSNYNLAIPFLLMLPMALKAKYIE